MRKKNIIHIAIIVCLFALYCFAGEPENNNPAGATALNDNEEWLSQVTEGDIDYYKITVTGPGDLDWKVYCYSSGPYVSFVVYDNPDSTSPPFRSTSCTPTNTEWLRDISVPSGTHTYYASVQESSSFPAGNGYYKVLADFTLIPDTTPPSPNPPQWLQQPFPVSATSVQMSCNVCTDSVSPPVQYYFDFMQGSGGHDSGWINQNAYTDTGLTPNSIYGYTVKAKDAAGNETTAANSSYTYTLAAVPPAPTVNNPTTTTLDVTPNRGTNSINTELAIYNETSGYYLKADGTSNGSTEVWLRDYEWGAVNVKNLQPSTQYCFKVKARNHDDMETIFGPHACNSTIAQPNIELTLYRISSPDGTPNSLNPGTSKGTFTRGETIRITLKADNTGGSADVNTVLNIRKPDNTNLLYDSHNPSMTDSGTIEDNSYDTPLISGELYDFYSFDKIIPSDAPYGQYDIGASIRNLTNWDTVYDTTSAPRNDRDFVNAWLTDQFTVVSSGDGVVRYYALLIGSGAWYFDRNAGMEERVANDCAIVRDTFINHGTNWDASRIISKVNSEVSRVVINNTIEQIGLQMDGDDVFVLFYSGHGGTSGLSLFNGDSYTPVDYKLALDSYIPQDAKVFALLNACHSGTFFDSFSGWSRSNTCIISSSTESQVTPSLSWFLLHPWNHSMGCYHFCAAIDGGADNNGDREVSIDELFSYFEPRMVSGSYGLSTPQKYAATYMGNLAVTKEFSPSETIPSIILHSPSNNIIVTQGALVDITWGDSDSDDDATISLTRDTDDVEQPWATGTHTWLAGDALMISEDDETDCYKWNTTGVPPGAYVIWAMINDNDHSPRFSRASGLITIVEPTGTIQVTLTPQQAVNEGAKWNIDGGDWLDSGAIVTVSAGAHTINYLTIPGWTAPPSEPVTITAGMQIILNRSYTAIPQQGQLQVFMTPQGAIDNGALWRVDGQLPWRSSGAIITISAGTHAVSFTDVPGWLKPDSFDVTVIASQLKQETRSYTEVFNTPSAVITSILPSPTNPQTDTIQFRQNSSDNDEEGASITLWRWTSNLGDWQGSHTLYESASSGDFDKAAADLQVGSHTITLYVEDDEGASDSTTESLIVSNVPPVIDSFNITRGTGDSFTLTGTAHDRDEHQQSITGWRITITGSSYSNIVMAGPGSLNYIFDGSGLPAGNYTISVVAIDDENIPSEPSTGTFEISMLSCDLNNDKIISLPDFSKMAEWWMSACSGPGWCGGADFNRSGETNIYDLLYFTEHWLRIGEDINLVGYWKFNETGGTTASDSSGYGNSGTLINGPNWTGNGALSFDGINDYVEVLDSASLTFNSKITLSVWILLNEDSIRFMKIIINPSSAVSEDPWENYCIDLRRKNPRFMISSGTSGTWHGAYDTTNGSPLAVGVWYHLAGTYDGSTMILYVNGQPTESLAVSLPIGNNNLPVFIGSRGGVDGFTGLIDDVRIYNRALTVDEVAGLYAEEMSHHQ
jgi:hypothetical protein